MKKDREIIAAIVKEITSQKSGIYTIYPTIEKLLKLVRTARIEGAGWALTDNFLDLDKGEDPRLKDLAFTIEKLEEDFGINVEKNPSNALKKTEENMKIIEAAFNRKGKNFKGERK